jgi:unsaturated rhamnogalacturonyl hydrolase
VSAAPAGRADITRLRLVSDRLLAHPFAFWFYGDSIGFEGLLAASDIVGDRRYEAWVDGALRSWAARGDVLRESDNTAPGHAMCLAYERSGSVAILERANALAAFLAARRRIGRAFVSVERALLREPYGAAPLPPDERVLLLDPGAAVYVDCLHFDPPLFAHLGTLTGRHDLIALAAEQALAYTELLQDSSGLFWHFRLEKTGKRYGYAWGRGQGWALLGLVDVLRYLPHADPAYPDLTKALTRVAEALAGLQEPSGGWRAVVTEPDSGPETSTAAFAAAGFAEGIRLGLLGEKFRECALAAWESAWSEVDDTGLVAGVSAAVWSSTHESNYANAPTGFDVPWGQGALLLAAKRIGELESR